MAREWVGSPAFALLPVADEDAPWLLRVKEGDREAIRPLWEKYERGITQFFLQQTNNRQDAEDLASDTLIAALQSIPAFRGETLGDGTGASGKSCSFRTYVNVIARHKLARWRRRVRLRSEVPLQLLSGPDWDGDDDEALTRLALSASAEPSPSSAEPLNCVLDMDRKDMACLALAGVDSGPQFKALLFHYLGGLPHHDVATALDMRSETVNSRLQDGRKTVRRNYQELDRTTVEA